MRIEGLEIKNATRTGLTIWEASHIKILNNTIHHTQKGGIWIGGETWGEVDDILIEGNTIYQTCQINNPPPLSGQGGGWPGALGSSYVTNITIRDNHVYENFGEGIAFTLVDSGLAENNTVHDNYSVNMYMDNTTNSIFRNNFTYTTYLSDFYRFGEPATNMQMANEGIYDSTNPLDQNQLINNIMMGGRYGFHYGNYENGGGLKNTLIANNTLYHSAWALIKIDEDAGHTNSTIANNIFYQAGSAPVVDFTATDDVQFHHNLWYGGESGDAAGVGDIHADPLLIQAGGTAPEAYHIQNASPAKNAGDNSLLPWVGIDFSGLSRPQGEIMDIGAFEVSDLLFFITLIISP
jgi:parallel beta-helix repeat protein